MSPVNLRGPVRLCLLLSITLHAAILAALHPLILSSERRFRLARALLERQRILLLGRLRSEPLKPPKVVKAEPPPKPRAPERPVEVARLPRPRRTLLLRPQRPKARSNPPEPQRPEEIEKPEPVEENPPPQEPKAAENPPPPEPEELPPPPPPAEMRPFIEPPLIPLPVENAKPGGGGAPIPEEAVLTAKGPEAEPGGPTVAVAPGGGRVPVASGLGGGAGGGTSGGGGKPVRPKPTKAPKRPEVERKPASGPPPPPAAPPPPPRPKPKPEPKVERKPPEPKPSPPEKPREEVKPPPPPPPPPKPKPRPAPPPRPKPPPPPPRPKPKPAPKPDLKELLAFQRLIKSKIERAKRYPEEARLAGIEGKAAVSFVVRPDGRPSSIKVVNSSGSPVLDRAAVETVKRAAPFLPYPKSLQGRPIRVKVSISFKLR